jgi:hypothetical protein
MQSFEHAVPVANCHRNLARDRSIFGVPFRITILWIEPIQSIVMFSKGLARDTGEKPGAAFPHPALKHSPKSNHDA